MANISSLNNNAPGLNQPLVNVFQTPVVSNRNPTVNDKAPLGTVWINRSAGSAYIAASIVANATTWISFSGGAGSFSSLTVTGNITSTGGAISANGDLTTAAGDVVATLGNIVATTGFVRAQIDLVAFAGEVIIGGDTGVPNAGQLAITNVTDTTQGAGALTMLSTNGNSGANTGFIKLYLGATTVWVPYFDNIAP